jgi:hypothetical protein
MGTIHGSRGKHTASADHAAIYESRAVTGKHTVNKSCGNFQAAKARAWSRVGLGFGNHWRQPCSPVCDARDAVAERLALPEKLPEKLAEPEREKERERDAEWADVVGVWVGFGVGFAVGVGLTVLVGADAEPSQNVILRFT